MSSNPKHIKLGNLNPFATCLVVRRLSWRDLLKYCEVSKSYSTEYSKDIYWEPVYKHYFPGDTVPSDGIISYKDIFVNRIKSLLHELERNPSVLGSHIALQSDKDFVLAAINQNGSALRFASEELKSAKDFVLAAVK